MKIAFRVDASTAIGSGHVQRCLTLATALQARGHEIFFVCRELPGHLIALIEGRFPVGRLPAPSAEEAKAAAAGRLAHASWLGVPQSQDAVQTLGALQQRRFKAEGLWVDHYALDRTWETLLRSELSNLWVIDDLADRAHAADALLDQNLFDNASARYEKLVAQDCKQLLGPQYALLRPEFAFARERAKPRLDGIRRVFVSYGGVDASNETRKAIEALRSVLSSKTVHFEVDVVIGGGNPFADALKKQCRDAGFRAHQNISNVGELMAAADLGLGAGGTMTWERCCVGLPTIVTVLAENQRAMAEAADRVGIQKSVGWFSEVTAAKLEAAIKAWIDQPDERARMSQLAMEKVDGRGAGRVADAVSQAVS